MKPPTIPLGFAVPSGDPVALPIGHMAVVGQTQMAGKTTTLEACASRVPDDYAVLAFVTKRGEGGFVSQVGHVKPYFRERADWEYVSSILEATLRERMKFERSWIMRACKGAHSLADVHRNVKSLMATAKGLSGDIYYQLDHYLDKIIPQVQALGPARSLTLGRGLPNVMDLSSFSSEMQGLIIASCLETAYTQFKHTIVVIPEAWEFLPRARKSPVTYAAENYIRKGGTLKNYLWIDSQDLAGVHTPVLKQVQIWLLGVQREINEVKRTLAHVHGTKKPKVDQVASLGLGQFIACFGQTVQTTYVQPAWMCLEEAQSVAAGHAPAIGKIEQRKMEDPVDEKLKADNDRLTRENEELRRRIDHLERQSASGMGHTVPAPATQAEFQRDFSGRGSKLPPSGANVVPGGPGPDVPFGSAASPFAAKDDEEFYQRVRQRLLSDPPVLAAIKHIQPEIVVEVTPRRVEIDSSNPRGRLARMIAQGLLDSPVKPGVIIKEFERTGGSVHPSRLSEYLGDFVNMGVLTREEGNLYVKTPGCKIGTKTVEVV